MGIFRHTPNDYIIIDDLVMPLSFFLTQEAAYALPGGATTQNYEQTVSRSTSDGSTQTFLTIPWAVGDGYITNKAAYAANYATYLATPATLGEAKTQQKNAAHEYARTYFDGNIQYDGAEYPASHRHRISNELYYFARIGDYDVSHYVYDKDGNQVNKPLNEMKLILDLMDKLHWVTNVNLDTHKDAIDALGTIGAVLAYDYSTGWPTLPYTG